MNHSYIPVRYAKALFLSARDTGQIESVFQDIQLIHSAIQDSPEFKFILDNPVVSNADKQKILKNTFQEYVHPLTDKFLDLIIKNNRETFLPDIARDFIDLYKKEQGITYVKLITAVPILERITNKIKSLLKERLKSSIQLSGVTDPGIIGGFILEIEDEQFDASVRSTLRKIKKELIITK